MTARGRGVALAGALSARRYLGAVALTAACTALAYPLFGRIDPVNIVMVYLLGATAAGLWLGRGPSTVCAIANTAAFDFFFVPPRFSFYVAEPQYLLTFACMLIVALVIANLMVSIRRQTQAAAARERRSATLYALCRDLAAAPDARSIAVGAAAHVASAIEGTAVIIFASESLEPEPAEPPVDPTLVRWVLEHGTSAGPGMQHEVAAPLRYLPLAGGDRITAVLVVGAEDAAGPGSESWNMLEALVNQIAMALERVRLAEVAAESRAEAERAALRNTLLASISHDLRAPLTVIAGAGCLVADRRMSQDSQRLETLGQLIEAKARDMAELLGNVLELIRLESLSASHNAQWESIEELVGAAIRHSCHRLDGRRVQCDLPHDLPMLRVDGPLIRQLLVNLLENAIKYTPPDTTIFINAVASADLLLLIIEDDGPGFGAVSPERLFDKFERGRSEGSVSGAGLGLAICRAIARLHRGSIHATHRKGGGARFEMILPQGHTSSARVAQGN